MGYADAPASEAPGSEGAADGAPATGAESRRDPFGPSQGPPADWLERVRKGAPHLLLPAEPMRVDRSGASNPGAWRPGGDGEASVASSQANAADAAASVAARAARSSTSVAGGRGADDAAGDERPRLIDRLRAAVHAFADPGDNRRPRSADDDRLAGPTDEDSASAWRRTGQGGEDRPAPPRSAAGMEFRLHPIEDRAADQVRPGASLGDLAPPTARRPETGPGMILQPYPAEQISAGGQGGPGGRGDERAGTRGLASRPERGAEPPPAERDAAVWPTLPARELLEPSQSSPGDEPRDAWPWPALPSAPNDQPAGYRIAGDREARVADERAGGSWGAEADAASDEEYGVWPALPPRSDGQDGAMAAIAAELDAEHRLRAERVAALRREQERWV